MSNKQSISIALIRELAAQGLRPIQIALKLDFTETYVRSLASKHRIALPRKPKMEKPPRGVVGRPPFPGRFERALVMADLYRAGKTLDEIGHRYGLTRERVRQVISKYHGLSRVDGGAHKRVSEKRAARDSEREAETVRRKGCSWAEYTALRNTIGKPTIVYAQQRQYSRRLGVNFDLTLWQWWCVWRDSGRWDQHGRGGFVLARKNPHGSFSPDNVEIKLLSEVISEARTWRVHSLSAAQAASSEDRSAA